MWESRGIMLTAEELVRRRTKTDFVLPQRGPKCFTPSGSWLESKQLQSLLDATKDIIAEERVERESALAQAEWDENLKVAKVTRVVGRQFEKFGHEDNMTIFLFPEEALYLLETNHLQLMYGGVSMSIQQAYCVLIGSKTGCTFMEYMVFSHLLKNGFKVLRHSAKRTVTRYERLIGLHQEHPKNRKSRRKCSAPKRDNSYEGNDKGNKIDTKIVTKNERCSSRSNTVNVQVMDKDSKSDRHVIGKSVNVAQDNVIDVQTNSNCFEEAIVSNFSSGSDVEILSEKSVGKSEESLEYDITEYSSSATEDSDCQVVFSGDTENNQSLKQKVIEEVNLGDSSESEIDRNNFDNSSQIKRENNDEEIIFDDAKSIDVKISQDEHNNVNSNFDIECRFNENFQAGSFKLEANEASVIELNNSNGLVEQNQELLVVQSVENINISEVSNIENEESIHENSEETSVCIPNVIGIKEEKVKQEVELLSRESVIQRNTNVPLKKESHTIILEIPQKEKEIEVIELDDDDDDDNDNANDNANANNKNGIMEDKHTILLTFPNCAGCHEVHCEVPPQHLCPPNVNPTLQFYNIVLDHLQDPQYGGNPRKRENNNQRFRNNCGRFQNFDYRNNNGSRFSPRPHRPFNAHFLNYPRDERYNRHGQWCEGLNVPRIESFHGHPVFREHSPMGPHFPPMNTNQEDQNEFAHFSGHPQGSLPPYQCSRPNMRHRGNYSPRPYRSNSRRNYPFSNRGYRYPRRKSRGGRSVYPDRNVAPRNDNNLNEATNEREEGFVSFNTDDSVVNFQSEQQRKSQGRNLGHKRHATPREENRYAGDSGRKRQRGIRSLGRDCPPSSRSQELINFLDSIQTDCGENTVRNLASDCNNCQENFNLNRGNVSALAASESSDSSESSSSASSYSSGNSQGSSDESMNESYDDAVGNTISALFKSDDLEDIDSSLKNLEIVHNAKFRELAAVSDEPLLIIKFDLYQPNTPFRRSDPPVPDFRVVVMQPDQNLPTSRQLAFLGQSFEDDVPLLFAIASVDSVAFYLQSVVNLPPISSKENVLG